jgi:uncharacterized protein (TIGR02246 family)
MNDIAALKATFENMIRAFSAGDLDALSAQAHEDVVFLGVLSPIRVEGRSALRQFFENFFAACTQVRVTSLEPHYRVIGPIGLAWGSLMLELQPKREELKTLYIRYSCTYGHFAERWKLVSMHSSWLLSSD